jgi:hypothetical protein
MNDQQEESSVLNVDIEDKDRDAFISLGIRLAILQGIYDCTYTEICKVLEEKFKHRKVVVEDEGETNDTD